MSGFDVTTDWLWPAALGVIPLAIIAACVCRWFNPRASTRHALWLTVLLCLFVPPVVPAGNLVTLPAPRVPARASAGLPHTAPPATEALGPRRDATATGRSSRSTPGALPAISGGTALADRRGPALRRAQQMPRPPAPGTAETSLTPRPLEADSHQIEVSPPAARIPDLRPIDLSVALPREVRSDGALVHAGRGLTALTQVISSAWARELDAWKAWLPRLGELRTTIASLPPVPSAVWLSGAVVLALVALTQLLALRRLTRSAEDAPPEVIRMVEASAGQIGLRRAPATLMVSARVSPMVTCWGRTRLILPRELWGELDDVGREAVVLHELAHLKRRDHWVTYAELAASALFWWHPVVWWVRQKLREEADACCDAWVTALRPRHRRSYAQALLDTRAYLSRADGPRSRIGAGMGVGLGVTGSGARRFARRLTMVMKERAKPRLSVFGVAMAGMLGLVGAASTPLWACPPDEKSKNEKTHERTKAHGQHEAVVAEALREAQVGRELAAKEREKALKEAEKVRAQALRQAEKQRATALKQAEKQREAALKESRRQREHAQNHAQGQHQEAMRQAEEELARAMQGQQAGRAVAAPRARRSTVTPLAPSQSGGGNLDGAQRQMEQLERRLERLEQQLQRLEDSLNRRGGQPRTMAPLAVPPAPGVLAMPAVAPVAPATPAPPAACVAPEAPCTTPTPAIPGAPAVQPAPAAAPTGGITLLEVPTTVVSPMLTDVTPLLTYVQSAVPAQNLDDDTEVQRAYRVPEGKRDALWELMSRQDVPVFVSQTDDGIQVHGTARQQAIFAAFLNMIHPGAAPEAANGEYGIGQPYPVAAPEYATAVLGRDSALQELMARAEALTQQADQLSERARELHEQSDDLEGQAEELKADAEELEGEARQAATARARELVAGARDLRAQATQIDRDVEGLAAQAESIHEEIEALEESASGGDGCDEACDASCEGCEGDCGDCCDDGEDDADEADEDDGKIDTTT